MASRGGILQVGSTGRRLTRLVSGRRSSAVRRLRLVRAGPRRAPPRRDRDARVHVATSVAFVVRRQPVQMTAAPLSTRQKLTLECHCRVSRPASLRSSWRPLR